MTAMDVFRDLAWHASIIECLSERIRRREAVMTGCGAQARDNGGGRSGGDASMRLLDYVGDMEELRGKLDDAQRARDEEMACCVYLCDMLPTTLGGIMSRIWVEQQPIREAAKEMGYSLSHVKRLKHDAEAMCESIKIVNWDRQHVPLLAMPTQ